MNSNINLERDILATLFKHGCIGTTFTPLTQLCKYLNHYPCSEIKKGVISLRKKKYIEVYKTYYGLDIRLIVSKIKEIKEIIRFED